MMAYFIPRHKTDDASYIIEIYLTEVIRLHAVPKHIMSDLDSKFLSHFWRSLSKLLGTEHLFSVVYHPQTDGQTEVKKQTLTTFLRNLGSKSLKDWNLNLANAEFITKGLHPMLLNTLPLSVHTR